MEVQDERSRISVPLSWIGFRGVMLRVVLDTPKGRMALDLRVDAGVSVGPERRGAHLSRNIEALAEALEAPGPFRSIEEYLLEVARRLLERHPYAPAARASAETILYVDVEGPGFTRLEPARARVGVRLGRDGRRRWLMKVSVSGMSVCPSAMRTIGGRLGMLPGGLSISHSQRVVITGTLSYSRGFVYIEDVAKALWRAPSAPAFTLLKRGQEAALVEHAHANAKLAEDIAREALLQLYTLAKAKGLPSDTLISASVDSFESIHPHNVSAVARAKLADLEALLESTYAQR